MNPASRPVQYSATAKVNRLTQAVGLGLLMASGLAPAATITVINSNDSGAGSLRAAVIEANGNGDPSNTIEFDPAVSSITLTSGQIDITKTLAIVAPPAGVTISGNLSSRIFGVRSNDADLTLENLTLIDGRTTAGFVAPSDCSASSGEGGAICARGDLTIVNSIISGNATLGTSAEGGAADVYGDLFVSESQVIGNYTDGNYARGGAFAVFGSTVIDRSELENNQTRGEDASGGALRTRGLGLITNSYFAGNRTLGDYSEGGAISADLQGLDIGNTFFWDNSCEGEWGEGSAVRVAGTLLVQNSAFANNRITGPNSWGGAITVRGDQVTIINSTLSGNTVTSTNNYDLGGAALVTTYADVDLYNVTITGNTSAVGAGAIQMLNAAGTEVLLYSTVLAGNSGPFGNFYVENADPPSLVNAQFSVFGDDPAEINGVNSNNIFTNAHGLGPFSSSGCAVPVGRTGSTLCAPVMQVNPGSPVIDAGANPLGLAFDQRGSGFPRTQGLQTDIGAYESEFFGQPSLPPAVAVPVFGAIGSGLLAMLIGLFGLVGLRRVGRNRSHPGQ